MTRLVAMVLCLLAALPLPGIAGGSAPTLDFSLHKKQARTGGHTLLIVGGIQGDEPGGFTAASLLVTDYRIESGKVWVVPNLNFESIVKRSRGVHGDMNRKFSTISTSDPEFEAVRKIKSIILDDEVDMVLNLHDGSGFYRAEHVDDLHNPRRWGQCIVIDQASIGDRPLERLDGFARLVSSSVNRTLVRGGHRYRIKNTRTREGNAEMAKTLTYFAIKNGKPAFGVEASKSLPVHLRAYYHLRVIEAYMHVLGIRFERDFELTPAAVRRQMEGELKLALYENRILLDVADARKRLGYVPIKRGQPIEFSSTNPLVAVTAAKKSFKVSYGNRSVTTLHPQYFDFDEGLESLPVSRDGEPDRVPIGSVVEVSRSFSVEPIAGYRVNAIGFKRAGVRNESGIVLEREQFMKRFSVDRRGTLFRIEVYRGSKFSGMVLVRFVEPVPAARASVDALVPLAQAPRDG